MSEKIAKALFLISLILLVYGYGFFSHRHHLFPADFVYFLQNGLKEALSLADDDLPFQYWETDKTRKIINNNPDKMAPGLTLISRVGNDDKLIAEVINADGKVIHHWSLDWFDIWPDASHLPEYLNPKEPPGSHIHGMVLMKDGSLVFNYDGLGLVRVDANSEVIWRLPYRTHHSLYQSGDGHLWVPGMITHEKPIKDLPFYKPNFDEFTILEVDPDNGSILQEISLHTLFQKNELQGLLYLSSLDLHPESQGDTLHLNDIELFPEDMEPGFFKPGDIMLSMRNINTVLVFDKNSWKKKFISIGPFVRQHDPDFVDGNTISIYDNNDSAPAESGVQSRILLLDAPSGEISVAYTGNEKEPFFSFLLGKHEWQKNGNILIADSRNGRVIEVTPDGEIIWEYNNIVRDGVVGFVETAQRLPAHFSPDFFRQLERHEKSASSPETASSN
ncbi:arylsulfotransferase family protein [Methylophaga sp.]|uniref:arylsulfotransferase family protein n=1 Tax=Methylophaga sp. TaxID=2024840 RepID=UPI001401B4BF|nr:arylsulfotransferase family protein [Methylophaga sp.]MTI64491.1 hypothetical protein [Methylophaga sp.]